MSTKRCQDQRNWDCGRVYEGREHETSLARMRGVPRSAGHTRSVEWRTKRASPDRSHKGLAYCQMGFIARCQLLHQGPRNQLMQEQSKSNGAAKRILCTP